MTALLAKIRRSLARHAELPLRERLRLGVVYLLDSLLAPHRLRACDRVGARARTIGGAPRVENRGRIEIGDDAALNSSFGPVSLVTGPRGLLTIGRCAAINFGVTLAAARAVRVGDDVAIGPYCVVADVDVPEVLDRPADARPIEIGDRVWLAARVVVRPGARIGAGSVITAGSVVEGEVPPLVVAGGVPARVLRRLPPRED
jgi:galactoside O-acetyltransferase